MLHEKSCLKYSKDGKLETTIMIENTNKDIHVASFFENDDILFLVFLTSYVTEKMISRFTHYKRLHTGFHFPKRDISFDKGACFFQFSRRYD